MAQQPLKPATTTDAIVARLNSVTNQYEVLMIQRGRNPYQGYYAFPGGFVEYGEDPVKGCFRELMEETNLEGEELFLIDVAGNPKRDPRKHVVSIIYAVKVKDINQVKAGDDAAAFNFLPLEDLAVTKKYELAFDHQEIIEKYHAWFIKEGQKLLFDKTKKQ